MKALISATFVLDEELEKVVGGDVEQNFGGTVSLNHANDMALSNANNNAAFDRSVQDPGGTGGTGGVYTTTIPAPI